MPDATPATPLPSHPPGGNRPERHFRYTRRRWGKAQAERYASQLQQCLTMLAVRPHAGRKRKELQPPGLHSFVQGSHVIFYQPQPYGVLIVRVLHGTQEVRRHLGAGETP